MIVITRQVMKARVTVHERASGRGGGGGAARGSAGQRGAARGRAGRPEGACRLGVIAGHVTLIGALDSSVFVLELLASPVWPAAMSAHLSVHPLPAGGPVLVCVSLFLCWCVCVCVCVCIPFHPHLLACPDA